MIYTYLVSCVTYKILLTVLITIALVETNFFKTNVFKLLFAIYHVSREIKRFFYDFDWDEFLENIDYESVTDEFTFKNARMTMLRK